MLSLRLNYLAFFFCLFLALSPANAIPVVIKRQSDGQSTTLMTQSTSSTPVGDMTQTCVITLTPITVNGQQEVQEVKTCTLTMAAQNNSGNSGGNANGGNTNGGGSNNGGDTTSSSTETSTDSSNSGSTSTDTSGTAAPTDAGGSPVSVNGLSTVAPSSVTASATDSTGASASATDSASTSTSATSAPDSAATAGSIPASSQNTAITSATQAADQVPSSSASAAFVVPGQKIQVLPIGLGVFAGISVIALIVVGLVTYERTKYRKAFRARKLAESGAGMGYGGMAQR